MAAPRKRQRHQSLQVVLIDSLIDAAAGMSLHTRPPLVAARLARRTARVTAMTLSQKHLAAFRYEHFRSRGGARGSATESTGLRRNAVMTASLAACASGARTVPRYRRLERRRIT